LRLSERMPGPYWLRFDDMKFKIVGICSVEALSAIPKEPVRFDLDRASEILEVAGHDLENLSVMVTIQYDGREVTIYRNGRITIYPAESKEIAADIAERFYDMIEKAREIR
jgi:TATA-box binding protein (TBP) (component of TFIID and TFIIIB)